MREITIALKNFFLKRFNFFNLNILRLQDFEASYFSLIKYIIVDDILKIYSLRKIMANLYQLSKLFLYFITL